MISSQIGLDMFGTNNNSFENQIGLDNNNCLKPTKLNEVSSLAHDQSTGLVGPRAQ